MPLLPDSHGQHIEDGRTVGCGAQADERCGARHAALLRGGLRAELRRRNPLVARDCRETGRDDGFARFLYRQQVRELRIIALWIAEPECTTAADFPFWAAGIINSEVAEQAAHALLSQIDDIDALLAEWCASENALLAYAALLAASRSVRASVGALTEGVRSAVGRFPDNRIVAQGATAALASVAGEYRERVLLLLDGLDDTPTARLVCDEMSWRMAE